MSWTYALFWLAIIGAAVLYIGDHLNTIAAAIREHGHSLDELARAITGARK